MKIKYDEYQKKLEAVIYALRLAIENDPAVNLKPFWGAFGVGRQTVMDALKRLGAVQTQGNGGGTKYFWVGNITPTAAAATIVAKMKERDREHAIPPVVAETYTDEELLNVFNQLIGKARQRFFQDHKSALIRAMNSHSGRKHEPVGLKERVAQTEAILRRLDALEQNQRNFNQSFMGCVREIENKHQTVADYVAYLRACLGEPDDVDVVALLGSGLFTYSQWLRMAQQRGMSERTFKRRVDEAVGRGLVAREGLSFRSVPRSGATPMPSVTQSATLDTPPNG